MTDIFISYSRKDIASARLLHEALNENGFETWIDWQDIPPSTEWLSEVYTAIEQSDTFIFILSSTSALSDICKLEIEHAKKNNKRLIPIVINQVDPSSVHPALAAINWIFSRTEDEFQPAIKDLITAIQTDYDWVKAHTRLQMRALEWERAGNDRSFLLRGADLNQAENWITVAAEKTPAPTLLQTLYLQASRQEETRRQQEQLKLEQKLRQRQRFVLWVVGIGLVVAASLGLLAWGQRNEAVEQSNIRATAESNAVAEAHSRATAESNAVAEAYSRATAEVNAINEANVRATAQSVAEEQRNIAQTGLVSALAMGRVSDHFDLALLLSGAAYQKMDTFESRRGLLQVLTSNPRLQYFLYGHHDTVYDLAISPDGARIASASADGTAILWDTLQRHPVGSPLSVDNSPVISTAFSPDSNLLATGHCTETDPSAGCNEGKVYLWDAVNGKQLGEMKGLHVGSPLSLAFSHNGQLLASGDFAGQIHLWDISSFQRIGKPFRIEVGSVLSLAFNKDDTQLISAVRTMQFHSGTANPVSYDGKIRLWNVSDQTPMEQSADCPGAYLLAVAFGQDGSPLGAFDLSNQIYIWNLNQLNVTPRSLLGFNGFQSSLEFSPDGSRLASGGCREFKSNGISCIQGEVIIWNVNQLIPIETPLRGTSNYVTSVALAVGGKQLVANSSVPGGENSILVWNFEASLLRNPAPEVTDAATIAYSPDGRSMAIGGGNAVLFLDFSSKPTTITTYPDHPSRITSLAYNPTGEILAVGGTDKKIYLLDTASNRVQRDPMSGQRDAVAGLAFMEGGAKLVSAGETGTLFLWDVINGILLQQVLPAAEPTPTAVALSPDGTVLAGAFCLERNENFVALFNCSLVEIRLWDTRTGKLLVEPIQTQTSQVNVLAFSQDSHTLASAGCGHIYREYECDQGDVRVYEVLSGKPLTQPMRDHTENVVGLAFSTDGKMLASLSEEENIILWDTSQWHALGQLDSEDSWTSNFQYFMTFSPDNLHLFIASGAMSDWSVSPQQWKATACQIANRELTQAEWEQYLPDQPYQTICQMQNP